MIVVAVIAPTPVVPSIVVATDWLEASCPRKIFSYVLETLRLTVLFVLTVFFGVLSGTHSTINLPLTVRGRLTKDLSG